MTEWHIRYGGRGVMIYWHVERKAACIYSQLKRCSSSEVAAMIEGVLRHCTEMRDREPVCRQPRPERGGIRVLPAARLRAAAAPEGDRAADAYIFRGRGGRAISQSGSRSWPAPIDWVLIEQQYDEMIKYAAALRIGTAEPEAILRRFTRNDRPAPDLQGAGRAG